MTEGTGGGGEGRNKQTETQTYRQVHTEEKMQTVVHSKII